MEQFRILQLILVTFLCLCKIHELRINLTTLIPPRKRPRDTQLPFHSKRRRIRWSSWARSLGPIDFKRHHRISVELFDKIHEKIKHRITTQSKYARKTCCRSNESAVDSRSRLSMFLKHLSGSKIQDIEKTHGVSRSTVTQAIHMTMDAIIHHYRIPEFPFDNAQRLQDIADGFRSKSTGGLFANVVGAFDGFLLRINKRCIGKGSGVQDPSKFYCHKGYYAINCQVCCDSNRKILSLSLLCPGAVPDVLAHLKSQMHRAIETGKLPDPFHFIGDNAYPKSEKMLTPFTRTQLREDVHGQMDNFNFYLSQLRINIECCFGMMINKFPILQTALGTTKLSTATKTFTVCCILHNLCIEERLENDADAPQAFASPNQERYRQVPTMADVDQLTEDADFEYVPIVDEVEAEELRNAQTNVGVVSSGITEPDVNASVLDKMLYKIAASGYVRPR